MPRIFKVVLVLLAGLGGGSAEGGVRSPVSLVRNVYAFYGQGTPDLSRGLPRDEETTKQFFDPGLRVLWRTVKNEPYDFLVHSQNWNLGGISITILRQEVVKTY